MVGGFLVLAPPTFGGVLAAYAAEPQLAACVDGAMPAYAALGEGDWVVASHVAGVARARDALLGVDASTSRFARDETVKGGGLEIFRPKDETGAWVGLSREYLLIGSDRRAIEELGPYAYRTLPTKPPSTAALFATATHAGLAGWVHTTLEKRWSGARKFLLDKDEEQRKAHGGRAPDFGDPKPLVAAAGSVVDRYLVALAAMQSAEASVDIDDTGIVLHLDLTPPAGDNPAARWLGELHGGSTAPLVAQDADALVTLFWRTSPSERAATAKDAASTLAEALGDRLPASERTDLGALLSRLADKRGEWASFSFRGGVATGVVLRLAAQEPKELVPVFDQTFDLAHKPGFGTWLRDAAGVKGVKIDAHEFSGLGPGKRARTVRDGMPIDVGWLARSDELAVGAGLDVDALLATLVPKRRYADDPVIASALGGLGAEVAWALVARPLLEGASPRSDSEIVALSKNKDRARLTVRTTGLLFRQLLASLDLP